MADPVNATAILAQAQQQAVIDAAPTEDSLNAGSFLPTDDVPDVLTTQVEGDPSVVREMLTKLNAEPAELAHESNYNTLAYLRDDLVGQRGMSQRIATEAMSVLPAFGKGRPVNYYSRHPSQTGYQLAIEELNEGLADDVVAQLEEQLQRLDPSVKADAQFVEAIGFKRRADQISMMENLFRDFKRIATDNGFTWDDACFQGCAVDPSQNATVPFTLTQDEEAAYSFARMDAYYITHLQAPALLEIMTEYLVAWKKAFQEHMDTLAGGATRAPVDIPKMPAITFQSGKTVSIDSAQDVFRATYEARAGKGDAIDTEGLLHMTGSAAQQARIEDLMVRLSDFETRRTDLAETLRDVVVFLKERCDNTDGFNQLIKKFVPVLNALNQTRDEIIKFCVQSAFATTYVATLANKVIEHAWKSVNQCLTTLQMPEEAYTELKLLVADLQAPLRTNVV